jgi:hypothetical protein
MLDTSPDSGALHRMRPKPRVIAASTASAIDAIESPLRGFERVGA